MTRPLYPRLQSLWHYIAQGLNGMQVEDHLQSQVVTHNLAQARRILDYENAPRRSRTKKASKGACFMLNLDPLSVTCPACGQSPGIPCTDISTPQALAAPIYLSYPHPERVEMLAMLAGDGNEPTITQFDEAVERTGLL